MGHNPQSEATPASRDHEIKLSATIPYNQV